MWAIVLLGFAGAAWAGGRYFATLAAALPKRNEDLVVPMHEERAAGHTLPALPAGSAS